MAKEIVNYVRAGYPVLYLFTPEEARAEVEIGRMAQELKFNLVVWSHSDGFIEPLEKNPKPDNKDDPIDALKQAQTGPRKTLYVFRDLHPFLEFPKVRRIIRDIAKDFKLENKCLILLSPVRQIPPDLEHDVTVIEFDMPDEEDITSVWQSFRRRNEKALKSIDQEEEDLIIHSALGLTTTEAENAISKGIIDKLVGGVDKPIPRLVMREKALIVKRSGILELFEAKENPEDVGGLEQLKRWLVHRVKPSLTKEAREFGLPAPKGIMLVGMPGCGKSLTAKAASNLLGVPLIRFDVGKVFGSLVGQSEAQLRTALATIDAVGHSVVWLDELDKAFAGMGGSGETDGGTGKRVFGTFITWMQEKKTPSFIVAAVNRIDLLPDELLRKGRFDEIFFVGLPSPKERKEIFAIQIRKYGRDPKKLDLDALVKKTDNFSGAEIEQSVIGGMYHAFHMGGKRELTTDCVLAEIENCVPLAVSRRDQLAQMIDWAKTNATWASEEAEKNAEKGALGRLLNVGDE